MGLKIILLATLLGVVRSFPTTTEENFESARYEERENEQSRRIIGQR